MLEHYFNAEHYFWVLLVSIILNFDCRANGGSNKNNAIMLENNAPCALFWQALENDMHFAKRMWTYIRMYKTPEKYAKRMRIFRDERIFARLKRRPTPVLFWCYNEKVSTFGVRIIWDAHKKSS